MPTAEAAANDEVHLYSPLSDGDSDYNDVTAKWAVTAGTEPAKHHIVYKNWGYSNDWSVDIYGPPGRRIVSPFGTKTTTGHATKVTVIAIAAGCATGKLADGGSRVTLEVKDTVTGKVLGRSDLMHVDRVAVKKGQALGPWTVIGYTARFKYTSCYQVTNDGGVHVHAEFINPVKYACYIKRANGAALTELTKIGKVGTTHTKQRAQC